MTAILPDAQTAMAAGLKTVKKGKNYVYEPYGSMKTPGCTCDLKMEIKKNLRVLDEQNAIHRYEWNMLPDGLTSELVERMLYYKGQLCFFFMSSSEQFFMLPFANAGQPDVYGRFLKYTPLIFDGTAQGGQKNPGKAFITGFTKNAITSVPLLPEDIKKAFFDGAVVCRDYTQQMPETIIPRAVLMDGILDMMAECFPMARTALIANSGVRGMRVEADDAADEVKDAADSMFDAAMRGIPYIPILGQTEFQELNQSGALSVEDYLLDMQALDNFRLSLYGLSSGGLFQKKSHMLEGEQEMNENRAKSALLDGLKQRQQFCDIVNSIWPLGLSVNISEAAMSMQSQMLTFDGNSTAPQGQQQPAQEASDGE